MNLWILLPTAVGLIAGLIGYLTKRSIDAIDSKIITTNTRIAEINSKLDSTNSIFDKAIDELRHEFFCTKIK